MIDLLNRTTKLRWRRRFRRGRRQVEDLGVQAEEQLEQLFFRRLSRLAFVRRFVIGWSLLLVLLIGGTVYQMTSLAQYYETLRPVPGGIYTEGIIGSFTNVNPIYATGSVDSAVSRLVFASLLKYDQSNQLVGDLAERWSADERGTTYTVTLRPGLQWQDGRPLTASDVVFTYQLMQNPDAKSPFLGSWQGVKISAPNPRTVVFVLPNTLVSFPHSLTTGIVPQHVLSGITASRMRSITFNTSTPVGAGPFKWEAIEVHGDTPESRQEQIALSPNPYYYAGKPKLQQFKVRSFLDEKRLLTSLQHKELTAASGLDSLPEDLANNTAYHQFEVPLTGEVGVFFKTSQAPLNDVKVRQALVQAVDQSAIIRDLGYPVIPVHGPFLTSQFAYDKNLTQLGYNLTQANKLLDEAGWRRGKDGVRFKDGRPLSFQLYSQSTSEYSYLTQKLQSYWAKAGVNASVLLQSDTDLQDSISKHNYDALVYGISIGSDPDVFAYWHGSQADALSANPLNFSGYKSATADKALEAGRTRADPALRIVKYRPFLETWRTDAPALMLYQPRYLYVTNHQVNGLAPTVMNDPTQRYADVQNWMIRQARVAN